MVRPWRNLLLALPLAAGCNAIFGVSELDYHGGVASGGAGADSGSDAGAGGAAGAAGATALSCTDIVNQGTPVPFTIIVGSAPAALGGAILPGTYVLTKLDAYTSEAGTPPGGKFRWTMKISSSPNRYEYVARFDDGKSCVPCQVTESGSLLLNAAEVTLASQCLIPGSGQSLHWHTFTATAQSFTLFTDPPEFSATFSRI